MRAEGRKEDNKGVLILIITGFASQHKSELGRVVSIRLDKRQVETQAKSASEPEVN